MSGRNFFPALAALLVAGCVQGGAGPTPPVITAQGFDIAEAREALPGAMGDVRLRFEVPDKIDAIWITEGTFRADLAKTLDRDLFRQFGLAQRPYSQSDVTINFRNYVNEKLTDVGAYRIDIEVTDHRGRSASVQVLINIQGANDSATASAAEVLEAVVATGDFALRRIGPGGVRGAEPFGITWRTIDPIKVTIRIKASSDGATKIARLDPNDFQRAQTRAELVEIVDRCISADAIDFDTANAAATGQVLAVRNEDQHFILEASASETFLTDAGTTVVVTGRYKY